MTDTSWITEGAPVCIVGNGTEYHSHPRIERITDILVICDNGFRFRLEAPHRSVPRVDGGGLELHQTCQRSVRV
jgi:hypothetical protein